MSEKIRKLKDEAARLLSRGKLADALALYEGIVKEDGSDLAARQKLAELHARLGRTHEAVREYQSVAGSYAADGLLLKAIAVCKIILQIDPAHTETQRILADLSTKRRGDRQAVEMPKAMSAALTSGKRSASEIRGVPASQLMLRAPSDPAPVVVAPVPEERLDTDPGARATPVPVASGALDDLSVEVAAPIDVDVTEPDGQAIEVEVARVNVDRIPPIPLFSDLPKEAFIALTERMELRVAAADEVLVQEGEPGASMFIIIQGKVAVRRRALDGNGDVALAELTDGAFFGEMALLSDAPRTASVVCVEDAMLFEVSRDVVDEITREHPSVGEVMKRFHKNRLLTNLLKTCPLFAPFSARDKKDLIEKFKSRAIEPGTPIVTRDRPGEGLYVLLSGRCHVLDRIDDKEVLIAELREGDVFGEMSMLWHKQTCASVRAATSCVVLRLPKAAFNELIMTHPQILEALTSLSERRRQQNAELASLLL